jgi:hypothetical protein
VNFSFKETYVTEPAAATKRTTSSKRYAKHVRRHIPLPDGDELVPRAELAEETIGVTDRGDDNFERGVRREERDARSPHGRSHPASARTAEAWEAAIMSDTKVKPDREDYEAIEREYGQLHPSASDEECAKRSRLAQANKLIRLYEQGKLPLKLMREMDKIARSKRDPEGDDAA